MSESSIETVQRLNWAVILFLTLHTAGAIWWASRLQAGFDYMSQQIGELKDELRAVSKDKYTAQEAQRDLTVILDRYEILRVRIQRLEAHVFKHEGQ
jgi:hypothetical protein